MKRINNIYSKMYDINNIRNCFNEVCKNTKNKQKVEHFKEYQCIYISRIYHYLKNKTYKPHPFHEFYIYDPKKRRIISQDMYDKVINHLVSRYLLYPAILPCLIDSNCASRPNKGTSYAIKLYHKYRNIMNQKYSTYYILKCDIKNYFGSIDLTILKKKIRKRIKDKDALNIIDKIIDSDSSLSIGFMTSQILGIYYLNDLDHFIKEDLKIKYYIRYQDDFLLIHNDKEYLKYCQSKIKEFLISEKLELNHKTRLYKNTNNFIFLGRNKYGRYAKYRNIKRKLKYKKYLYDKKIISFQNYLSSYISYHQLGGSYEKK